jgi:hypothetical protein
MADPVVGYGPLIKETSDSLLADAEDLSGPMNVQPPRG